ncbi:hypothetical protein EDB83DRAFT_123599 [Lactarius deliciosus]|nr:hypothetical protein EDB83DRAFT_123599 [Lactarius deliciosus]
MRCACLFCVKHHSLSPCWLFIFITEALFALIFPTLSPLAGFPGIFRTSICFGAPLRQHLDHARSSGLLHSTAAAETAPKGTVRLPLVSLGITPSFGMAITGSLVLSLY